MSGHGLTLDMLERMANIAGISVFDLIDLARDQRSSDNDLSISQEETLATDPFLCVMYFLLARGWSVPELKAEFDLQDWEINLYLTKLDKIRLINLFPMNKVVVLNNRINIMRDGPIYKLFDEQVKKDFVDFSAGDREVNWQFTYHRLSESSISQINEQLERLLKLVKRLGVIDRTLPKGSASWKGLLFLMRPIDLQGWRKKK